MMKFGAIVTTKVLEGLLGNSFFKAIPLAKEELDNTTHQRDFPDEIDPRERVTRSPSIIG